MKRRESRIARNIDKDYKQNKKYQKRYREICKGRTCEKCNYKMICESAEVGAENNEHTS